MLTDMLCPSPELLKRSLDPDDPMPDAERRRIESHVDDCQQGCKETISALLRGTLSGLDAATPPLHADTIPHFPASAPPVVPGFEILGELGRGGMGVVYKAWDKRLNRIVALKMVLAGAHASPEDLVRFLQEAEAVAALQHVNIVQIFESGEHDGLPYFALEFVEGGSLATKGKDSLLPAKEAASIVEQAARAIAFAHSKGLVHRDLKPENVLLTLDGTPKITDFGLVKRLREEPAGPATGLTHTGAVMGTPSYMAPEQARGKNKEIGPLTDVYALGAILYRLLTGRPPFHGSSAVEILTSVVEVEPVPPRQLRPGVARDLETACLKCLSKEPSRRYASAADLADDLHRFQVGEPIVARPVGQVERTVKWMKRRPSLAALVALAALLVVGSIATAFWYVQVRADRVSRAQLEMTSAVLEAESLEDRSWGVSSNPQAWATVLAEAHSALDRVERARVAAGRNLDPQLLARAESLRERLVEDEADRQMVETVNRIRIEKSAINVHEFRYSGLEALPRYRAAYSHYGLQQEAVDPGAVVARWQSRPAVIQTALLAGLNDWLILASEGTAERDWLRQVADQADPDPLRAQMRQAIAAKDRTTLERVADDPKVFSQPPATLDLLGRALKDLGALDGAVRLLRRAQEHYPDDFWLCATLADIFWRIRPARPDEAISYLRTALALQPQNAFVYNELGNTRSDQRQFDVAVVAYQRAIELQPDFGAAYYNLGNTLFEQRKLDESLVAYRKAIELLPRMAEAHINLGRSFHGLGKLEEAAAAFRKASELEPTWAKPYSNLAGILKNQGKIDNAIAASRKAIELDPKYASAYNNLGLALKSQHKIDEAVTAYRKAIELQPDFATAYVNLGGALADLRQLENAVAAYRKAIELQPDFALAYYNLGLALRDQRKLTEAVAAFREADRLLPRQSFIVRNLKQTSDWLKLDIKLPAILAGTEKLPSAADTLACASFCAEFKHFNRAAARFYAEAFGSDPKSADDLEAQHRYSAACSAALAASGSGEDAAGLDAKERDTLRQQSLIWLQSDLTVLSRHLDSNSAPARAIVQKTLRHWQIDEDLASVRDSERLAKLTAAERAGWENFWADVGQVLGKATAK